MKEFLPKLTASATGAVFLLLTFVAFIAVDSLAEGSKDLYPAGMTTGRRAYLMSRPLGTTPAAFNPFPTAGTHRVYAKTGEIIYAGFSMQGKTYSGGSVGYIVFRAPNGTTYNSPNNSGSTTGLIATRTEELNGPDRGTITNGYTPFSLTVGAGQEGIWEVDFVAMGTGTNFTKGANYTNDGKWVGEYNPNENWVQPVAEGSSALIAAWDISVGSASNQAVLVPGRVYTNVIALTLPNNYPPAGTAMGGTSGTGTTTIIGSGGFYGVQYVLTNDGYTYRVRNNGMNGASWEFFGNNKGIVSGGTQTNAGMTGGTRTYQSQNSIGSTVQNIHDPRYDDGPDDITYKIFYGTPAADLPATAAIRYFGGSQTTTWLKSNAVSPTVTGLTITGIESGQTNIVGPDGAQISFNSNVSGTYTIEFDINNNGSFTDAVDRKLTGNAVAGTNIIPWDGKNGSGSPYPVDPTIRVRANVYTGEVHFPFVDVEINPFGVIIERLDASYSPVAGQDLLYWDDSNIDNVNDGTPPPISPSPAKNTVTGLSSNTNGHKFGATVSAAPYEGSGSNNSGTGKSDFGNSKLIDSWSYVGGSEEITRQIYKWLDLGVTVPTPNTNSICENGTITYTVNVTNSAGTYGSNAAEGASFRFNAPAGLIINSRTITINSGTYSETSSTGLGSSQYNAVFNQSNPGSVTYTFTCTVTGPITNPTASVIRPPDVWDTDATSTVTGAPSDFLVECNGAPSGNDCNNIRTATSSVTTSPLPSFTACPSNITQDAGTETCSSVITYTAIATGETTPSVSYSFSGATIGSGSGTGSGSTFNTGITTVTLTATNSCGTAQCVFTVTVVDHILPTISCQGDITLTNNSESCSISYTPADPTVGDNCSVSPTLTWVMSGKTTGSGSGYVGNQTFNSGETHITYTVSDGNGNSANCSFTVTVEPCADLVTVKTLESSTHTPPQEGDVVQFSITVTNNGPDESTAITLTDKMPDGITYTGHSASKGTYNPGTGVWTDASLLASETATLILSGTVNTGTGCSVITNTTTKATGGEHDITDAGNDLSESITIADTQAPVITTCAISRELVGCSTDLITDPPFSTVASASSESQFENGTNQGVVSDNCEVNEVTYTDVAAGSCPKVVTRIWTIKDVAGNSITCEQTITLKPAEIVAADDTVGPINGKSGGDTGIIVLNNDNLNGQPVVPSEVTISSTPTTELTVNTTTGAVTVTPGTPAGTYTITYTICEVLNPANCDDAIVTVVVEEAPIVAADDTAGPINGKSGGDTGITVLNNDNLNGQPVVPSEVTISSTPTTELTVNTTTGAVTVTPGTPAGTYTITYTICEVLNPANCDDAIVTVVVEEAPIVAADDTAGPINGKSGGVTGITVLTNDQLNGKPVVPSEVTISSTPTTELTVNTTTGAVSVTPGTPAGTYTITYTICEVLNPANCDDAIVTVVVEEAQIVANDDDYTASPVNGMAGGTVSNILTNDLLNGVAVVPSEVTISSTPTGPLTVNSDGSVTVAPDTKAGTYTITYTICEVLNPANCDDAIVTVVVEEAPIVANDDDYSATPVNGMAGGTVSNILTNDLLNGVAVVPAEVTISSTPTGPLTVNSDGSVTVAPDTKAGTYTITYTICEVLNPANCDEAIITVVVEEAPIVANDDDAGEIDGYAGVDNVLNVFDNDRLNGDPVIPAQVTLSVTVPDPNGYLILNEDGSIDVAPGTPAGTYTLTYTICEVLNPSNCDDAVVTVRTKERPDITPNITAARNVMAGITEYDLYVRVTELNGVDTQGLIEVIIPKDNRWTIKGAYNTTLTGLMGLNVENSAWSISESSTSYIFTTTKVIPAYDHLGFGFRVIWNAGNTKGRYTITTQITSGSGNEVRVNNNTDSERIDYFVK